MANPGLTQKLLFVLGKGGVGRTTAALSLALACASRGERTLVVQWALQDAISPLFGKAPVGHKETPVTDGVSTMNFDADEAIREYFVEHLGMKLLHSVVIENRHVQKLIHAAPGVQEIFFLGRLLWLAELARGERGWSYDRIIVDTPATGHGVSLFTIAPTIAGFGMTGPLAAECERVAGLLSDGRKVGVFFVTLPEELPVEETLESIPRIERELGRGPLFVVVNKSIHKHMAGDAASVAREEWFQHFSAGLSDPEAVVGARLLLGDLLKRNDFEHRLKAGLPADVPALVLSDIHLAHPEVPEEKTPVFLSGELAVELAKINVRGMPTPGGDA